LANVWPWAAVIVVLGLLFILVGRSADPVRRPEPSPKRVRPAKTSDRPQQA
jgi:hypothetical protein